MSDLLPLPALYTRALNKAASASGLPTINDETQELIQDTLSDLIQLASHIDNLSLFSSNEMVDDISTPDLMYLSLPFIRAEIHNRVRTTERDDRISNLMQVQRYLRMYVSSLETYHIISETERALHGGQQPSFSRDAEKRRELKIRRYKAEKDLRIRIEVIARRRRRLVSEDHSFSDFDLVASLLLPSEDDIENSETENVLREATLLLLRLFYAQACAHLEGVDQEIQLLRTASPPPPLPKPPADERQDKMKEQDMWKIDAAPELANRKPLLDSHGKPLRPFTILPASMSDRTLLHARVFGPGHRLPTMTIEEYLEIERQRGGILSTGGSQSEANSSEQVTVDSEMDGTVPGELKLEEKRYKDEEWAQYKDTHPRGAGNTMGRG